MPAKRKLDTLSIVAWVKTQLQLKADGRPYTTTLADAAQALDYADGVGVKTALERAVRETAGLPDDNAGKITAADLQSLFPQMGQEQRQPASVAEIVAYVQGELRRKKADPKHTTTLTNAAKALDYADSTGVKNALMRVVRYSASLPMDKKITIADLEYLFPATNWRKAVDKPIDSATLASLRRMLLPLSEIAQELDVPIRRLQAADFDRVPSNTEQYPEAMQTNRSITKQEILDGCIAHQSIICFALAQKIPPIIFLARIGRYARGKDGPQFLDRLPEACRRELAMGQALANWDEIVQGKDLLLPKTCPLALLYAYHTTLNGGVVTTQEALADKIGLPPAQAMQHWNTLAASGLLPPTRPPTAAQLATQRDLVRQ